MIWKCFENFEISMAGSILERVTSHTYLGVVIYENQTVCVHLAPDQITFEHQRRTYDLPRIHRIPKHVRGGRLEVSRPI